MEEVAGQPLVPGTKYRGVIWSLQGDQEFFCNTLGLPHWATKRPCWQCDARRPLKNSPCPKGKSVKILCPEKQRFEDVLTSSNHAIFKVPGVGTEMIRHDALHVIYAKGVGSHLLGSLLHSLCYYDDRGRQTVAASDRLATIFEEVQKVYAEVEAPTRLTNLRLSMFTDPKSPHKKYPSLHCKASELKHFAPALLVVLRAMLDESMEHHMNMLECLQALCKLGQVFDEAGIFLTKEEFRQAMSLGKRFFEAYDALAKWAKGCNRKLFNIVHKFHTMQHMIRDSQFMNPRFCWNFRAEDYVGQISKLAHSTSFGLSSLRLSAKVAAKYLVLLHLQLVKPGYGWQAVEEEP